VDSLSGAISPVPATSAKALNGSPNGLAADPTGRFLYVSYQYFNADGQSYGQQGVQEFALDATTGAMTEISGSPLTPSGPLITNNAGTFLYLGSAAISGGTLTVFAIDQQTGALTLSAAQGPAFGPVMAMDPQGRFLFTAGGGVSGNEIGVDTLDPATGAGTAVGFTPAIGPNFILGLAVDPAGKYLFALGQIGAPAQPAVQSFVINADGSLNPTGGPQPAGKNVPTAGSSAAVDASGRFLYVVTDLGLYVRGYTIDSATGAISELPSSPLLAHPARLSQCYERFQPPPLAFPHEYPASTAQKGGYAGKSLRPSVPTLRPEAITAGATLAPWFRVRLAGAEVTEAFWAKLAGLS